jgi:ELWxxDGT repeat protein
MKVHTEALEQRRLLALTPLNVSSSFVSQVGLNPGGVDSLGTTKVLYAADSVDFGRELFVGTREGQSGRLLMDLNPGAASSSPKVLLNAGKYALFYADGGSNGRGLWRTDGTGRGTKFLLPTSTSTFGDDWGSLNGKVVGTVSTNEASLSYACFITDGTPEGTQVLLTSIGDAKHGPGQFVEAKGRFAFISSIDGEDALALSDGTPAGSRFVAKPADTMYGMFVLDGKLYVGGSQKNELHLYELNPASGAVLRTIDTDFIVGSAGAWSGSAVVIGAYPKDQRVRMLRFNGSSFTRIDPNWEAVADDFADADVASQVGDGHFIFTTTNQTLYAVRAGESKVRRITSVGKDVNLAQFQSGPSSRIVYGVVDDSDPYNLATESVYSVDVASDAAPSLLASNVGGGSDYDDADGSTMQVAVDADGVYFDREAIPDPKLSTKRYMYYRRFDGSAELLVTNPSADAAVGGTPILVVGNGQASVQFNRRSTDNRQSSAIDVTYVAPDGRLVSLGTYGGGASEFEIANDPTLYSPGAVRAGNEIAWTVYGTRKLFITSLRTGTTTTSNADWANTGRVVAFNGRTVVYVDDSNGRRRIGVALPTDGNTQFYFAASGRLAGQKSQYATRVSYLSDNRIIVASNGSFIVTDGTRAGTIDLIARGLPEDAAFKQTGIADARVQDFAIDGDRVIAVVHYLEPTVATLTRLLVVEFSLRTGQGTYRRNFGIRMNAPWASQGGVTARTADNVVWLRVNVESYDPRPGNWLYRFDAKHGSEASKKVDESTEMVGDYAGDALLKIPTVNNRSNLVSISPGMAIRQIANLRTRTWTTWNAGKHFYLFDGTENVFRYTNGTFVAAFGFSQPTSAVAEPDTGSLLIGGTAVFASGQTGVYRYTPTVSLAGTVFNDRNRNGVKDGTEKPLSGWRVFLDRDGDNVWDKNEQFVRTTSSGRYEFYELPKGTYSLCLTIAGDYVPVSAIPINVKIKTNQTSLVRRLGVAAVL